MLKFSVIIFSRMAIYQGNGFSPMNNRSKRNWFQVGETSSAAYYNRLYPTYLSSKHAIITMPLTMYFNKGSYIARSLDMGIQQLAANGILQHWIDRYRCEPPRRYRNRTSPQLLDLSQFRGIFFLCGGLLATACIVFAFEIIITIVRRWLHQ